MSKIYYKIVMKREEDLISEILPILRHYGETYSYLSNILRAKTSQEFYHHFLAIGERSDELIDKFNSLQTSKISFLINLRLKQFTDWQTVDYSKLVASLKVLKKQINFNINYQLVHEKCPNILTALHPTLCHNFNKNNNQLCQFLQNNSNILNKLCNKQTYSLKCYQKLSEEQKELFQIISVRSHCSLIPKALSKEQIQNIYTKHAQTNSPRIFAELLKCSPQPQEKVLQSKLVNSNVEQGWQLIGDCKLIKSLNSKNLARCLQHYKYNYRYILGQCFYVQAQQGIYFKYDIVLFLRKSNSINSLFNIQKDIARENINDLNKHLNRIQLQSIQLISKICEANKKTFVLNGTIFNEVNIETVLFFCFKLIIYSLRTNQMYVKGNNIFGDQEINISIQNLSKTLYFYIKMYLDNKIPISHSSLNNLCQIFRWLKENQKYNNILNQLFSGKSQQKSISTYFIQLLKKYLKQKKGQKLPYHLGIWLLYLFNFQEKLGQALGEEYYQLCNILYHFLEQNINQGNIPCQLLCRVAEKQSQKIWFNDLFLTFLKANPQFTTITLNLWLNSLNNAKLDTINSDNLKRFEFIVILFNDKNFTATQQIRQFLKEMMLNYNFKQFRSNQRDKDIWYQFVKKMNLDLVKQIDRIFSLACENIRNQQISTSLASINQQNINNLAKNIHLLTFFLSIIKIQQITQQQAANSTSLLLKLKLMEFNFAQQQFNTLSKYSKTDLQWMKQVHANSFQSVTKFYYSNDIFIINDILSNKLTNIIIINRIVMQLQGYLTSILTNINNPYIVYKLLQFIVNFINNTSNFIQCQLFPQFYNYHRQFIVNIAQVVLNSHHLEFKSDNDAQQYGQLLAYMLLLKKQKKDIKVQFNKLNYLLLQKCYILFLSNIFSNQNWSYSFLINNIQYKQSNNKKFVEVSVNNDFIQRLTKIYTKQKLKTFYRILKIINDAYHRQQKGDLQCQKITYSGIALTPTPTFLFTKESQLQIYYNNCKELLNKIFQNYLQYEDQQMLEEMYQFIVSKTKGNSKQRINKELLKKVMHDLTVFLTQGQMQRKRQQRMLFALNIVHNSLKQSISQLYSIDFVCSYLKQIESDLQSKIDNDHFQQNDYEVLGIPLHAFQNKIINQENVQSFFKFIERLIPNSMPQLQDQSFNNYILFIINLSYKFIKMIKDISQKQIQSSVLSFIVKIIRFKKEIFNQKIIEFLQQMEESGITYSQLFCEIIDDDLGQVSIQLQIKCYFLKLLQKNNGNRQKAIINLSKFAELFSQKHKQNKQKFLKVVQAITQKTIIYEQNIFVSFLRLRQTEQFQSSKILNKKFVQYEFKGIYRQILSSFIENINKGPKKFQLKIRSLRIIAYNYPILISYILMHPILFEGKIIPFIDFLFIKITKQDLPQSVYYFFTYMSLDLGLFIKLGDKVVYFSEYICYHLICKLMAGQLNNRSLLFIYSMIRLKRFADLFLKKIDNEKSLCDLVWQKLIAGKQDSKFKNAQNCLIYTILSFAQRYRSLSAIEDHCQYKKTKQLKLNQFNLHINENWLSYQGLICKQQHTAQLVVRRSSELQNKKIFQQFEKISTKWYTKSNAKKEEYIIQIIKAEQIMLKAQHLKHIGVIQTTNQRCKDIQTSYSPQYIKQHFSFQQFYIYFLQHKNNQDAKRKRKRMRDHQFQMYLDLVSENDQEETQKKNNEEMQNQFNIHRQSSFAPEEFRRVMEKKKQEVKNQQIFQEQLQKKLNTAIVQYEIVQQQQQKQQYRSQLLTGEMLDILSNINYYLNQLRRPPLTILQIQGKTQEERLQFLKIRELEADFDYKQFTMGVEQFQDYCLSNVNKLDRLTSERRNIVRNMQDTMLLKFVQRSVSSDSVDYIIDTIDQNYNLLPNTLQHKNSFVGQEEKILAVKLQKKINYIKQQFLPNQTFQEISEERLYEVILGLYYYSTLLQYQYFIPFLQNKKAQAKIINTLLYIYNNPFENSHFPNKLNHYDLQKFAWNTSSKESIQQLRENIIKLFKNGLSKTFYLQQNYLNKIIDFKGIKDIVYTPKYFKEQEKGYKPIYQVLQLILQIQIKKIQKNEGDYQIQSFFSVLKGVSKIPSSQIDKLMILFKRIHKQSSDRIPNETIIYTDHIKDRLDKEKSYQIQSSLQCLLKDQQFRQKIKQTFPINQEGRDPFFISLFINSNVYTRQQLLDFHKKIIKSDIVNGANVYFANKGFTIYSQQEISQSLWIKESKNIIPSVFKSWPKIKRHRIKEQPIYRIITYQQLLSMQVKSQLLHQRVVDFLKQLNTDESQQFVAQRKKGIFQSAFLDLRNKPDAFWYDQFSVKFMNEQGQIESGYGQGVAKDWYSYVTKGMVNLNYAIFMKTSKNYYFFNRESWINPRHLQFLQFIGKIFALSIIKRQFYLTPSFSILIYKMITGEKIEMQDIIKEFDQGQVINNIQKLRQYHDDSLFCQTFVYQDKRLISNRNLEIIKQKRSKQTFQESLKQKNLYLIKEAVQIKGEQQENSQMNQQQPPTMIKIIKIGQSIELVPGGSEIPVNMSNREDFIKLTKEKIYETIVNGVKQQFNAFITGFKRIVKPEFIKYISAEELRQIAEGCDKIDINDLKKYVKIGKSIENAPQVGWFWQILQKLSSRDRMYLIQHWTGLPKISVQGFRQTNLHLVKGQYDKRLFAQTCFNKLHLPLCENQLKLEEAIKMAIKSVKQGESIIED